MLSGGTAHLGSHFQPNVVEKRDLALPFFVLLDREDPKIVIMVAGLSRSQRRDTFAAWEGIRMASVTSAMEAQMNGISFGSCTQRLLEMGL